MNVIYLVVWSGGYESPAYEVKTSREEAEELAKSWWNQHDDDSDWIDVLKIDGTNVERISVVNDALDGET